jgi:catechol 2,3-dioxygenase-like lactoylglutathione lyase family enzyme
MQPLSGRGRGGGAVHEPRNVWVQAQSIVSISRVVSDLSRAESFYRSVLRFGSLSRSPADPEVLRALGSEGDAVELRLRLGEEELVLVQFESAGRNYPVDSRSNDLWFQHLAIVVSDMDTAYSQLRSSAGWQPISTEGPETLPASNGGVRAFKFRDPDGHPLELLWFPPRHGNPKWQERTRAAPSDEPFLGIDHSALSVSSTRRSLAFYRSLGLSIAEQTVNSGPAQSRLDGLGAAHVRVTGLRPAGRAGPGLELLAYRPPGRAREDSSVTDLSTEWTTLGAVMAGSADDASAGPAAANDRGRAPALVKKIAAVSDPDGHRFVLVNHGASLGRPA